MTIDPGEKNAEARFERLACVGLGSNLDPELALPRAIEALGKAEALAIVDVSRAWQSAAVGSPGPDYLNAAVTVTTTLSQGELRDLLKEIEERLGRRREMSERVVIDLDLLAFNNEWLSGDVWSLAYRAVPVAEIWPEGTSREPGETLAEAAVRLARTMQIVPRPEVLPRGQLRVKFIECESSLIKQPR